MEPEGVTLPSRDRAPANQAFVYGTLVLIFAFIVLINVGFGFQSQGPFVLMVMAGFFLPAIAWNYHKRPGGSGESSDGDGGSDSYDGGDGDSGGYVESSADSCDSGSSSDGGCSSC